MARTLTHAARPTVGAGFTATPTIVDLGAGGAKSQLTATPNGNWVVKYESGQTRRSNKGMSVDMGGGNALILGGELFVPTPLWNRETGYGGSDNWPQNQITIPAGASGTWAARAASSGSSFTAISVDCTAAQLQTALESVVGAGNVRVTGGARSFLVGGPAPFGDRIGRMVVTTQPTGGTITVTQVGNWFNAGQVGNLANFNFVHVEGAYIHGPGLLEGFNIFSNKNNTTVHLASCFIDVPMYRTHPDHQHADAIQCYQGPQNCIIEKCTIRCSVNGWMVQPLQVAVTGGLTLGTWAVYDTVFEIYSDWWDPDKRPNSCMDVNAGDITPTFSNSFMVNRRYVGQTLPGSKTVSVANKVYTSGPNLGPRDGIASGQVPLVMVPEGQTLPSGITVVQDSAGSTWTRPNTGVGCDPFATPAECGRGYDMSYP